jgi:phosphotransferase system enzyme I (PtsI)
MARRVLSGIAASKGIGIGKCLIIRSEEMEDEREGQTHIRRPSEPEKETELFRSAVSKVESELQEIKKNTEIAAGIDAANIFEAQLLMLKDPSFTADVERRIHHEHLQAAEAVKQSSTSMKGKFSALSNKYIRERAEDMTDIESRLMDLLQSEQWNLESLKRRAEGSREKIILVSQRLAAAAIPYFGKRLLAGIVTETGSGTSHLSIVARSMNVPAVLGVENVVRELKGGEVILVDGTNGHVAVNPSDAEISQAMKGIESTHNAEPLSWEPTETIDKHRIQVLASVEDLRSVEEASTSGAEGIGLFRTEFLYFDRGSPPTEDELYEVIRKSIGLMSGRRFVVRTLDIGGDKKPNYIDFPKERNPLLGLRGIRFSLKNPSLLESQLAAILRAGANSDVWIMFPMISTINELISAKQVVEKAKNKLRQQSIAFSPNVRIGIMIETPSSALLADKFAEEADFFSIGTNDLVQYALVADRENENVADVADPLEPSVLRLIQQTITAAHSRKRHVGICGEMAADLEAIPILIGLGLDELSVNPSSVGRVKKMIQSTRLSESRRAASKAVSMSSALEIRDYMSKKFQTELKRVRETT